MIQKGEELLLSVHELSSEGKGVSRTEEGFVVFTEGALPGDEALVKITKKKSSYAESKLISVSRPSPYRTTPGCTHFGVCGGCKVQNLDYARQLVFKTNSVRDALERIGGFTGINVPDAAGSPEIFGYRNKMEFSFSNDIWRDDPSGTVNVPFALGLHVPKFHSKIVSITNCLLQPESANGILNLTRDFFTKRNISSYSTSTHTGFLRFLIIRQTKRSGHLMVNLVTREHDGQLMKEFSEALLGAFPGITTIVNSVSEKKAQIAFAEESIIMHGDGVIRESLRTGEGKEFIFTVSPNSFFQTNTLQCENLFDKAVEFAELSGGERVLDLYCGTGAISFWLSQRAAFVKGVELVEDSINDAVKNAAANGVRNCSFQTADIKEFLESPGNTDGYDTAVLDPPRSGLHPKICSLLSEASFGRIVYVSCNPQTQARDLGIICSAGNYRIDQIQPFDMFPHTIHVENIVSLRKV